MLANASGDKLPQSVCRNENAPKPAHSWKYAASNQALHRPD